MSAPLVIWSGLFFLSMFAATYSTVVGGAALLLIPALSFVGLPLITAIATVRLVSLFLQSVSIAAFAGKHDIAWKPALWTAFWSIPGGLVGAHIAISINPTVLAYIVGGLLLVLVALILPFNKHLLRQSHQSRFFYAWMAAAALALGVYGGFYGASFSTFVMVLFVMLGGQSLLVASGNSSVVSVALTLAVLPAFIRAGLVNWYFAVPLIAGGSIGAWYGVDIAIHKGFAWIKHLLVFVMIASAIKLFFF